MTNSSKPVELISAETLALGERMRRATLGDAHVDRPPADAQADAAVLRQALLGDVELGHDLQPADQRGVQRLVRLHHLAQRAIHPKAHRAAALVGLDVDVARAITRCLREQSIEFLG